MLKQSKIITESDRIERVLCHFEQLRLQQRVGAGPDRARLPEMLIVNGTPRPTRNSRGQHIAATPEGIEDFWRHFGLSQMLDDQGRPLVFYHGSRPSPGHTGINAFKVPNDRDGIYFTPDADYANAFTCELFDDEKGQGAVYPVYLNINYPYRVITEYGTEDWEAFVNRALDRRTLQAHGFDAAVLQEPDGTIDQIIAFSANQVIWALSPQLTLSSCAHNDCIGDPMTSLPLGPSPAYEHQARDLAQFLTPSPRGARISAANKA